MVICFGSLLKTVFPRKTLEESMLQIAEQSALPAWGSRWSPKPAFLLPLPAQEVPM